MSIWKMPISLEALNKRGQDTLVSHLGIEFTEIGEDFLVAKMPVDRRTVQPLGILHGGASCVLAETVGSVAANFCIDFSKEYCVGLDINANHVRSVREGYVSATARPYHLGKTTQVWSIEMTTADHKLVAVSRLTMAVLKR